MQANDSIADAIQRFINSIYSYTFAFVSAMASVGVVTMAIIQTIKDLFPLRRGVGLESADACSRAGYASAEAARCPNDRGRSATAPGICGCQDPRHPLRAAGH